MSLLNAAELNDSNQALVWVKVAHESKHSLPSKKNVPGKISETELILFKFYLGMPIAYECPEVSRKFMIGALSAAAIGLEAYNFMRNSFYV